MSSLLLEMSRTMPLKKKMQKYSSIGKTADTATTVRQHHERPHVALRELGLLRHHQLVLRAHQQADVDYVRDLLFVLLPVQENLRAC